MFFRFFIDIFPEFWKKMHSTGGICVFVVSDLSVYGCFIWVLSEFYLQGNRTGCHWKERLSDRLDFVFFFSLRLFCLFFSFIIWNIKSDDSSSPNMTNNAVLLPAYTATKSFAFPHTCRGQCVLYCNKISGITTSEFVIVSIFIDISMPSNIWRVD